MVQTGERPAAGYLRRVSEMLAAGDIRGAVSLSAEAAVLFPRDEPVLRSRAVILRRAGRMREAADFLTGVIAALPNAAWAHAQAGLADAGSRAIGHFRQAFALEPGSQDYRLALVHALARTGDGEYLDEAYRLLQPALPTAANWSQNDLHVAFDVLKRVCAYDELDALGDPLELGRKWAEAGNHTALFMILNQTTTPERRATLLDLHRLAARPMEDAAARDPLWPPDQEAT